MKSFYKINILLLVILALLTSCKETGRVYKNAIVLTPVVLSGSKNAEIQVKFENGQIPDADVFMIVNGNKKALPLLRQKGQVVTYLLTDVPMNYSIVDLEYQVKGVAQRLSGAITVIDRFKIVLSFDDGPAVGGAKDDGVVDGSPTNKVIETLLSFKHGVNKQKTGVSACFFVLSQPDIFLRQTYFKAETKDGAVLVKKLADNGFVIGAHCGGDYKKQTVTHARSVTKEAYDVTGDDVADGQNALESELLECINRVVELTGKRPKYVRPTLWVYSNKKNPQIEKDVLATYKRLGLKMILTDAKFPDGGYSAISVVVVNKFSQFRNNLKRAFLSGERELVFSMHDSNNYTANTMNSILAEISETFSEISFAGKKGDADMRLDYAQTSAEVERVFDNKKRFVMFPKYNPVGKK